MVKILLPMDMYNTFRECDHEYQSNDRNARAKVMPFMRPLIDALTAKRPNWRFVVGSGNFGDAQVNGDYHYHRFIVMSGEEELGWISRELNWRTGESSYEFNSRSLDKKRTRGRSTRTKDLKKAVKVITENFNELSFHEHVQAVENYVASFLANQHSRTMYRTRTAIEKLSAEVIAFLQPQWDKFIASLPGDLVRDYAMTLPDLVRESHEATAMYDAHKPKNTGAYVRLLGEKYVVKRLNTGDTYVYTQATLPDDLRGPIGALKLVPDETLVDGIGVRAASGAFYIVTEVSNGQQS